ncbi:MAG: hypothetical protein MR966_03605 [Lachnospiraceae bacterium]|nr:hypothetical protein [Lachnospiraceae bacterium]
MNKNITSIANQKLGGKLSACKVIVVDLLEITSGTLDGNNRNRELFNIFG